MSSTITSTPVAYAPPTVFPSSSSTPKPNSRVFFGFSTFDTDTTGKTQLFDIDLVNRDLLNAFYTRVGERVSRPDWGCAIWDYLMEPLTPGLYDLIVTEAQRICETDTRLILMNTQVFQYENGLRIEMTLLYLPWRVVNTFTATFNLSENAYFSNQNEG